MNWKKEEENILIEKYKETPTVEISKILNRTEKSIRSKANKLNLSKNNLSKKSSGNAWSENEKIILIEKYKEGTNLDLIEILNRTKSSIYNKANELNLKKSKEFKSKMIGIRNKMVARDLNYENLEEIASKYKSRGEFQFSDASAYTSARVMGILENICSHMIKQSYSIPQLMLKSILDQLLNKESLYNTRKIIKPYELDIYFPEFKLAFEYDGKRWHRNNKINKYEICKNIGINLITIVENNRKYESDIKDQLIKNLKKINKLTNKKIKCIDILNIKTPKSIFSGILDTKSISEICNKYYSYTIFKRENKSLHQKLYSLNLLGKYTSHMKKIIKHNDEDTTTEVKKYEYLGDFIKNSHGHYIWIKKNKKEYLLGNLKLKGNRKLKYQY